MKIRLLILCFFFTHVAMAQECFESGKVTKIPRSNQSGEADSLNPQKTKFINQDYQSESIDVTDVISGVTKNIKIGKNEYAYWSANGDIVLVKFDVVSANEKYDALKILKKSEIRILDPNTGKVKKESKGEYYSFSNNEFYKLIGTTKIDGKLYFQMKDSKGVKLKIPAMGRKNSLNIDYFSETEITVNEEGEVAVYGPRDKMLFKSKLENYKGENADSGVGTQIGYKYKKENIFLSPLGNDYLIVDLDEKTQKKISMRGFKPMLEEGVFSKDKKTILVKPETDSGIYLYNLETQTISKFIDPNLESVHFDNQNRICGIKKHTGYVRRTMNNFFHAVVYEYRPEIDSFTGKTTYECFDSKTNTPLSIKIVAQNTNSKIEYIDDSRFIISPDLADHSNNNFSYLFFSESVCAEKIKMADCDCASPVATKVNLDALANISMKLACEQDFSEAAWSSLTQRPVENLNEKNALIWLKRFSKPKSFSPQTDLSILLTLIEEKLYLKYPVEFGAALNGVIAESPFLFATLSEKYPALRKVSLAGDKSCLTKDESEVIDKAKIEYFRNRLDAVTEPTEENLQQIYDVANEMLNDAQKKDLAEDIGDLVVEKIKTHRELDGIFPSKIYKFALNKAKEKLHLPNNKITDLTTVRLTGSVDIFLMGTNPFEYSVKTLGGFYLSKRDSISDSSYDTNQEKNFQWEHDGKKYSAVVELKKDVQKNDIAPSNPSPNYSEMKKNKVFRGLIVAGSNLGKSSTENVVGEYIEYFNENGFEFEEAVAVANLPGLLKERMSGKDQAHYFVKEAHSDGDEKNLFKVSKKGKVLRGTKKGKNGVTEIVEIVYPGEDAETELISNTEFGSWMKEREKINGSELVYINSSCWSATKAIFEISAAQTPKLINIPTTTTMSTFTNQDSSVMFAVIDGLYEEKTYAEMRNEMEKNSSSYKSKLSDVFIFPDQEEYSVKIRNLISTPVHIESAIFQESNNVKIPYAIESDH
jgi:hypothetical protein